MTRTATGSLSLVLAALGILASGSVSRGTILYNEAVTGDLSNNQAAPTALTLGLGTNSLLGTVGAGDTQDWVALTVPAGVQLSTLFLITYQSTDGQGFTGVQAGSSFVGSTFDPSAYLGYAHFGTAAVNGNLPATNLVGTDILPLMGNNTIAQGSQGFTPPLASGTYTFLIQQLGASTVYQFDYNTTQVPGPGALGLLAIGSGGVLVRRSRARRA